MSTYSRIATALSHLLSVSPVDETARTEVQSVIDELHLAEENEATDKANLQGQIDALTGRIGAVESDVADETAGIASVADAADPPSGNDSNGLGVGSDNPATSEGDTAPQATGTDGGGETAPAGDVEASGSEAASPVSDASAPETPAPGGEPEAAAGDTAATSQEGISPSSGSVDESSSAATGNSLAGGQGDDTLNPDSGEASSGV